MPDHVPAIHLAAVQDELRHVRQMLREAREEIDNLLHENRRLEQQLTGGDERRPRERSAVVLELGREHMVRSAIFAGHVAMEDDHAF
jgi:hypothetical protein